MIGDGVRAQRRIRQAEAAFVGSQRNRGLFVMWSVTTKRRRSSSFSAEDSFGEQVKERQASARVACSAQRVDELPSVNFLSRTLRSVAVFTVPKTSQAWKSVIGDMR